MDLDLQSGGLDFSVRTQITNQTHTHVCQADVTDEALVYKLLHTGPGLGKRGRIFNNLFLLVEIPAWRVALLKWYKFERDRIMDEIQIEIVEAKVSETFLTGQFDMFFFVVSVPQF